MNIRLRPITIEDAQTSVKWRNIPELWVHTTFKADRTITLEDEINWVKKVTSDPTSVRFAIIADDTYVGNIYLTDISNKNADYHIFIGDKNYWGKGVARIASVQIIDYGKKTLQLDSISLSVKKDNGAAYHLYSTLGFVEAGDADDGFTRMILDLSSWSGDPRAKMN